MQDQQRGPQMRDPVGLRLPADVVQEPPAEAARPPADQHVGLPTGLDLRRRAGQQVRDVRGVTGCADGDDGGDLGDACGGGQDDGAAEGVPDQQLGPPQPVRRKSAAATRSSIDEPNAVSADSSADPPGPVKSRRSTAMPRSVRPRAIRAAAGPSWPQVKQCANNATAVGSPSGRSSHPASGIPAAEPNVTRCRLVIGVSPTLSPAPVRARYAGNPAGFVRIPIKVEASADRTGLPDADSLPASPSWMSGKTAGSGTGAAWTKCQSVTTRHFARGRTHRR